MKLEGRWTYGARAAVCAAVVSTMSACKACAVEESPAAGDGAAHAEGPPPPASTPSTSAPPSPVIPPGADAAIGAPTTVPPKVTPEAERSLFGSKLPVADWVRALAPGPAQQIEDAAKDFVRCTSVTQPDSCVRLDGDDRLECTVLAPQVSRRAAGPRGWFLVPVVVDIAKRGKLDDAILQHYAEAVETGDRAQCATVKAKMRDCEAVASGDGSACPQSGEKGCPRRVTELSALRRGFAADNLLPPSLVPYVTGRAGADACEKKFHAEIVRIADAGAASDSSRP